jgi:hypothetical protein
VAEKMGRETGLEPVASGLGTRTWFVNKELMRPWTTILIICTHGNHRNCSTDRLNELIELSRAVDVLAPEDHVRQS